MTQPINLGIIGAGLAVKQLHWPALKRLRDRYTFSAVADIDPEKADAITRLVGANKTFTDYRELLALPEVEAVLISLPIHLTAHIAIEAARSGKHVILEKPLAANLEQARLTRDELARYPVKVLVAENMRYRDDLIAARRLIDEGAIGDLILVRMQSLSHVDASDPESFASTPWRQDIQYRGGALLDGGVHHAAAMRGIAGEVEWVQAFTKYGGHDQLTGPTTLSMNLRFRSGAIGAYLFSSTCHNEDAGFLMLTIHGTAGTIEIRDTTSRLLRPGQPPETIVDNAEGGYYGEFLNFYAAIREDQPIVSTVEQGYRDMELILRAIDSAEQATVLLL
ncbi:MAG: Gfo/Idh/MocA family oxidoreductase [Chloroflexi bacterium]|nr:Gfo/Idh/MocA family oxidoreductase [Chloroflexota bacterium]